ncbi:MAG: hypothetical protein Q9174_005765, partial [Haloplaca sp. 1 TL-2023]
CFVPVLKLLTTSESSTAISPELDEVKGMLEGLLLQHILVSARMSFDNRKRSRDAQEKAAAGAGIDEILTPLEDLASSPESISQHTEKDSYCITTLFSIVIKHTPLDTAKQRIAERSWLQYMFDHITKHAVILTDLPIAHQSPEYPVEVLKMMLKMLLEKGMRLEQSTLRKILTEISNMFDGRPEEVEWELIGLCLKMDPDVFVVAEASDGSKRAGWTKVSSNESLVALAARLSDLAHRPPRAPKYTLEEMVAQVILPLVNGFADVRFLSGFVDYWRLCLLKHHSRNESSEKQSSTILQATMSIWEDERVLQEVAKLIEARMTAKQVDAMLLKANSVLAADVADSSAKQRGACMAESVVLDCILHACTTDDMCIKISENLTKTYSTLVSLLQSWQAYSLPRWRMYRCMAVLKRRWIVKVEAESDMKKREATVISSALEKLEKADKYEEYTDIAELEQAFNYILAVIGKASWPLSGELATSLVNLIMNALKRYHHDSIMSDQFGGKDSRHSSTKTVQRFQEFLFLCTLQICSSDHLLPLVSAEHQKAIFKALLLYSISSPSSSQQFASGKSSSNDPWQRLLGSSALKEFEGVAKIFRAFQVDTLLASPLGEGLGKDSVETHVYEYTLSSIHQTSMRVFDRKQRASIFNRVTDTLIQDSTLSLQSVKEHLQMLISCITVPSSSMPLLKHPFGIQGKEQKSQKHADEPPALFKLAHRLSSQLKAFYLDIELVRLLKSFTDSVLIYQLTKGLGDGATTYLIVIFNHLVHLIRHQYWQGESFSTVLLGSALDFFKSKLKDLPDQLRQITEQLPSLREEFRRRLSDHVHLLCQGQLNHDAVDQAIICIDSLISYKDLVLASPDIERFRADCQHISATLLAEMTADNERNLPESYMDSWLQIIQEAQHSLEEPYHSPSMKRLEDEKGRDGQSYPVDLRKAPRHTIREQRSQISSLLNTAEMLDTNKRLELLASCSLLEQEPNRDRLLLLQALISSRATPPLQIPDKTSTLLSGIVNATCDHLQRQQAFQISVLLWQTINILLRSHARTITQWHIDQIMSAITTAASASPKSHPYTSKQHAL